MAELVNQRIEGMINELEQMQRINLYSPEEIREISRRRTEFEYKIQRRTKHKEDFIHYIAYDIALLEDIALRRKKNDIKEKKSDIEYAISKRVNKIFKQFIERFKEDVEIYFQYIKFCKSVSFEYAISSIIGQMLKIHGDCPKMWLMASKWQSNELRNVDDAKSFLLKGIQRHPTSSVLFMDLFELELRIASESDEEDLKMKQIKKAEVIYKSAFKNTDVDTLLNFCDIALKYDCAKNLSENLKQIIWANNNTDKTRVYIARKELQGIHWTEVEELDSDIDKEIAANITYFISAYEYAITKSKNKSSLFTTYIHDLLKLKEKECAESQKVKLVKRALEWGHMKSVITGCLYEFWLKVIKAEGNINCDKYIRKIVEEGIRMQPSIRYLWDEKMRLDHAEGILNVAILTEAAKYISVEDLKLIWTSFITLANSTDMVKQLQKKVLSCEDEVIITIKPQLLRKAYEVIGITEARKFYNNLVSTPPLQLELFTEMIDIEKCQENIKANAIRKLYESALQHFGQSHARIWLNYINFEVTHGSPKFSPAIYQRAVMTLRKDLVDQFIKDYSMSRVN